MKSKNIALIVIIILVIVSVSLISLAQFKIMGVYIPLDIGSYNMTLGVATVASYAVSGVPVNFGGSLSPGSTDNTATSTIDILNTGNIDLIIDISGAQNFEHGVDPSTYYFSIDNAKWNDVNNPAIATPLSTIYAQVEPSLIPADTQNIYLWVGIPAGQYAGPYNSTIFVQVTI